ncbi:hypothetical protein ONZ51_g4571 [Trametes cubensis]|uniref:DUF6534 domain-containing protein n=1 Tax=Trametes cubensis TaxID=1111947 RepID=A0AAD7XA58_9APHY|nr:hypothetical protein ONZ51_g4571 [Trametes cubensis]
MSGSTLGLPGLGSLPSAGGGVPSLDNTYGAVLLGTFFGLILYGLAVHQAYRYSRLQFGDPVWTKAYVVLILALDTFHVILCMHMSYYYLVDNYFKPQVLFTRVWSIDILGLGAHMDASSQCMVIVACQSFYAHRVWLVGRRFRPLVAVAVVFFMGELDATVQASLLPDYAEFRQLTWLYSIAFGLVVVSDILLTSVLIVVLRRSRTGFAGTDSRLDVLIAYTISTGLLTDIFSLLSFIFPLVYLNTDSMIYIALDIVVTKLYTNSVIGTLNFRKTLAAYGPSSSAGPNREIGLSVLARSGGSSSGPRFATSEATSGGTVPTVIDIKVTHEYVQDPTASFPEIESKGYGTDVNA